MIGGFGALITRLECMKKLSRNECAEGPAPTHDVLLQLVQISTAGEGGHDACIGRLLNTVAEFFDLPLAIISQIDGSRYEVEFVRDRHE